MLPSRVAILYFHCSSQTWKNMDKVLTHGAIMPIVPISLVTLESGLQFCTGCAGNNAHVLIYARAPPSSYHSSNEKIFSVSFPTFNNC